MFDRSVTPVLLFVVLYLGVAVAGGSLAEGSTPAVHWVGLAAAIIATALMMLLYDRRLLDLGLRQPPRRALTSLAAGLAVAIVLAVAADGLIVFAGGAIHRFAGRIHMTEVLLLFVPAVLHEELVFRGYPFQKLLQSSRAFAVFLGAAAFAMAHLGNRSLSNLALLNVFLAGLLLSLLFVWSGSLWNPIGFHFGWNAMTGLVLGHEVSGYVPKGTLLAALDRGPELVSGGRFGMEGSICTTVVQIAAVLLLWWWIAQNRGGAGAVDTLASAGNVPADRIDPMKESS